MVPRGDSAAVVFQRLPLAIRVSDVGKRLDLNAFEAGLGAAFLLPRLVFNAAARSRRKRRAAGRQRVLRSRWCVLCDVRIEFAVFYWATASAGLRDRSLPSWLCWFAVAAGAVQLLYAIGLTVSHGPFGLRWLPRHPGTAVLDVVVRGGECGAFPQAATRNRRLTRRRCDLILLISGRPSRLTLFGTGTPPRRRRPSRSPCLPSGPCRPPWPQPSSRRRSGRRKTRSRP